MTNVVGQRMEPTGEAAFSLIDIQGVEKVYRTGTLEYAAQRRWTWRSGRGDMVTVAGRSGCSPEPSGPMGW
jgi:hypothetical protein